MNLQENIIRIKEVMGIINEEMDLSLKRRIHLLPKYIRSAYSWLNPKAFDNFEKFLERVVFSSTRDFVADFGVRPYKDEVEIRSKISPYVEKMIQDDFMEEIRIHYNHERWGT